MLTGAEKITGTTMGWRGLGMPAPTKFDFESADQNYRAEIAGLITSELGVESVAGKFGDTARWICPTAQATAVA